MFEAAAGQGAWRVVAGPASMRHDLTRARRLNRADVRSRRRNSINDVETGCHELTWARQGLGVVPPPTRPTIG